MKDIREKADSKFIHCLRSSDSPYQQRTMAAFVHSELCNGYRPGQDICLDLGFHRSSTAVLSTRDVMLHPHLKKWIIHSVGKLCEDFPRAKRQYLIDDIHLHIYPFLLDFHPAVRIAAIITLGDIIGASVAVYQPSGVPVKRLSHEQISIREKEIEIAMQIMECFGDGCPAVRREAVIAISKVYNYLVCISS